jgi:putative FmdB family regulatory protein
MPIYEYRCTNCGNTLEVMQKVSDPAPASCTACEAKDSFERLMSRTSFQLKGGGWYSDLYGSVKKDAKGDTAATPAAAPAEKTSEKPAPAAASTTPSAAPAPSKPSSSGTGGTPAP